MAVAHVRDHTPGTTIALSDSVTGTLAAEVAAGNVLIAWMSVDNSTANAPTVSGLTKPANEPANWTRVASHNSSSATAYAGLRGEMWAIKTTVAWASGTPVTATFSLSRNASTMVLSEYSGVSAIRRSATVPSGATSPAGTPSFSTGTTPIIPGDLVLGGASFQVEDSIAPDTDTTGGVWSSGNTVYASPTPGLSTSAVGSILQHKIVTDTSAQTYNPVASSASGATAVVLASTAVFVRAHSGGANTTFGTAFTGQTSTIVPAGNVLIAAVGYDNASTAGTPYVVGLSVPAGETASWVKLGEGRLTSFTAGNAPPVEVWGIQTSMDWPVNTQITATLSASTTPKAMALSEYGNVGFTVLESSWGYSSSGLPSATIAGAAAKAGDLVIGACTFPNWDSSAVDSDTTNGTWNANVKVASSTTSAGSVTVGQHGKVLTASGAQTYNPTSTGSTFGENSTVVVMLLPAATYGPAAVDYTITLDPPAANIAEALTPTLSIQTGVSVIAPIADPAMAGAFDPTVTAIIRQDVTVDLSAVPMAGATALAIGATPGIGPSIPVPVVGTVTGSAHDPNIAPVDRAYTDFSEYDTGVAPTGWTLTGAGTATVITDATGDGGKALRLTAPTSSTNRTKVTWGLVGSHAAGNFLTRMKGIGSARSGILFGGVDGYVTEAVVSSTLWVQVYQASADVGIGSSVNTGIAYDANTWYWMRTQIKDDRLQVRMWADGSPEPTTWHLGFFAPTQAQAVGTSGLYVRGSNVGASSVLFDSFEYIQSINSVPSSRVALRYQVLPLVQKNLGMRWAVGKAIDKSVAARWKVDVPTEPLVATVGLAWNTTQRLQTTTALRWDTFKEAVTSRALRWRFVAEVDQVARNLRWNVRQAVETRTLDVRWAEVVTVDEPTTTEIAWALQAPVEKRLTARWVTQSEGRVTLSLRARWDTLVTAITSLRSRWSSNLDSLGVLVQDFDDKPLGQLEPAPQSRWQVYDDQSQFEQELQNISYAGLTVLEDEGAFGRRILRRGSAQPVYFLDEPDPWEHDVVVRFRARSGQPVTIDIDSPNTRRYGYDTHRLQGDFTSGGRWTFGYWYAPQNEFNRFTQSSSVLLPWTSGEWMWARIQLRHDKVNKLTQAKAKVWKDGTPEPKNWTLDYTLNGVSGPAQLPPGSRQLGTSNEYVIYNSPIDLDRVSWTTPHTRVVLDGPATAGAGALEPVVSLRQTVRPTSAGRADFGFPEPVVEIGDQVLVSWIVLEIPAAVSLVEAVEVFDMAPALLEMPNPTITAQASRSVEVPTIQTSVQTFEPVVTGHQGVQNAVDNVATASIAMPDATVRVVAHATTFGEAALATAGALEPTLTTEFNARIDAPTSSATFRAPKPDSINGSREVEIDAVARAGASMIPVQGVVATLTIQVDNATLAQAQALPADARTGLAVATSPATASASAPVPAVQTSIRIGALVAQATARARDTALTRTGTRFQVGDTALVITAMPAPAVQVFFTRVDATVSGAAAYGLFKAVAPEFLSTPAEIGDALVLYLGSTVGDVRLGRARTDVSLGSTHGTVELTDVRDEERV